MNITFESKDLPIKTVTIKGRPHFRALTWELYNKHIDSIIIMYI